jgi:Zn-finger nucleic acid-binding protein
LEPISIHQQLQIDFCLTCRGIWFDKNELTRVHTHGNLPEKFLGELTTIERDRVACESCGTRNDRAARQCVRCGATLHFLCPVCHIQMDEAAVGQVVIDRCQACQGVWLDGGELALLFNEFKHRKKIEADRVRAEGGRITGDLAAWGALETIDTLIWHPYLIYHAGGAVARGVGAAAKGIGHLPEVAGDLAEGAGDLVGGAAAAAGGLLENAPEMAGDLASGAAEFAGGAAEWAGDIIENVPEIAESVAEVGASFLEMLFEIISSLFDS